MHMSLFLEALPRALTTQRKMGDNRLLGAQHSKKLKVGNGWEAEKGHPGNLWRQSMLYLGHSPSHKSWVLLEEPGTHLCPGATEPVVLGSFQLSPLRVIFSHLSICQQVPSFNQSHRLSHEEDRINNRIDPVPTPFGFSQCHHLNTPLTWQNDCPIFTDEKLRLPGTITPDH